MKVISFTLSEQLTKLCFYLYKKVKKIKYFRNENLDFYLKQSKKNRLIGKKNDLRKEYFFSDRNLYISYLYSIDNREDVKKLILKLINTYSIDFTLIKSIYDIQKEVEKVFKSFSEISNITSWSNICSGKIKKHKFFESIELSISKTGDNFLHLIIKVSLNEKTQSYIEEIRKKDDKEIFKLKVQIYPRKIFCGSSTTTKVEYIEKITSIYKELNRFFEKYFHSYISKCFASLTALKIKNNKNEQKIAYDLDQLGFDFFSYAGKDTRISYNFKTLFPQINILRQFDDISYQNVNTHNELSMNSHYIESLLYQFNFHCYLLKVKNNMRDISYLLDKNKTSINKILSLSQKFYSYQHIFDKMRHEHGGKTWENLFQETIEYYKSVDHLSIDKKKKINFKNKILQGLNYEIENVKSLFSLYSARIDNYIKIKSIESSNDVAIASLLVSIIAILISILYKKL